ncbi:MAG: carboxypeptidase regulatory-like domain-containing protein [Thiotrichaceae bacterium]
MINKYNIQWARALLVVLITTGLTACGGGGGGGESGEDNSQTTTTPTTPNTPTTPTAPTIPTGNRSIQGQVNNLSTGALVDNATITIAGQSSNTTAGEFTLNNLPDTGELVVEVRKNGFVTTSRKVTFTPDSTSTTVELLLLPVALSTTFSPTDLAADLTLSVPNSSASVLLPAGSLIDPTTGAAPTTNVTANLTPINPAANVNAMPGDYSAIDEQGNAHVIESFGALSATFNDASGNELNLAPNTQATIRIPVSSRNGTIPQTIPLYYFEESSGLWIQQGTATLDATSTFYEGTVSHFTVWNADILYDSITITGCVENAAGNKVTNARIVLEGQDYNGSSRSFTNAQGIFTIQAKRNGTSLLNGIFADKLSNTLILGDDEDSSINIDITGSCLILINEAITARFTWGVNPADLDTHLFGPNDYHIWWRALGSLNTTPFAQLDVDDTNSFGPEVLTIVQFPEPGTYRYAIHHFAGSSSITNSSAQIRLRLNGQTTVFAPPAGQSTTDDLWNVFNLIVDANGNVTLEVVNTWSSLPQSRNISPSMKEDIIYSHK